jgi:hypothetical protein
LRALRPAVAITSESHKRRLNELLLQIDTPVDFELSELLHKEPKHRAAIQGDGNTFVAEGARQLHGHSDHKAASQPHVNNTFVSGEARLVQGLPSCTLITTRGTHEGTCDTLPKGGLYKSRQPLGPWQAYLRAGNAQWYANTRDARWGGEQCRDTQDAFEDTGPCAGPRNVARDVEHCAGARDITLDSQPCAGASDAASDAEACAGTGDAFSARNAIAVVATSGSSGPPKYVLLGALSILHRLAWNPAQASIDGGSIVVVKTSVQFVDSLWELLAPMAYGTESLLPCN